MAAAAVAVCGASALYFAAGDERTANEPTTAAPVAKPRAAAGLNVNPGDPGDETVPSLADMDSVARLLGDARRLAANGHIEEAKAAVDKAGKIIPGSVDIAQARVDIDQMSTPQYRLAQQLSRARLAIAHDDGAAAERALDAAAAIDPAAPQIAELRQQMQQSEQQEAQRKRRIAALLTEMRQAIARRDLAAADRALNEAERLNIRDPAIDPARVELAHAQEDDARSRRQ